jgi:hypothetical protein
MEMNKMIEAKMRLLGKSLLVLGTISLALVPIAVDANSASGAIPNVITCGPGFEYRQTAHTQSQYGKGSAIYLYNFNASSATLSAAYTSSQTLNYGITATGGVNIDLIFTSVQFGAGVSLGKTTGESFTGTATVNNIPEHYYGVVQLGDAYFFNSAGTYFYLSSLCVESGIVNVNVRFPENPNSTLLLTGVNTVEATPWQQTN